MKTKYVVLIAVVYLSHAISVHAIELEKVAINGYTSFEFEKQIQAADHGDGDPNASFDADLFDLVLNLRVSDRIRAATDVTWEHGAASEDGRGNVALEYGFVEYTFSDLLRVRVGKMFTPFGVFNEIHTAKPAFLSVKEASSTNKSERIVESGYRFFPRWNVGIALQGDGMAGERSIDYNFLVANGEQENTNPFEEDDNLAKAIAARFRIQLWEDFRIGNSFYLDKMSGDDFDYLLSEGIEIEWLYKELRILAEMVMGFKKPDSDDAIKQIGWFIQPSYRFANGLIPYVRFEYVDPNLSAGDDYGFDLITGINYEIHEWFMVKIENNYFKGAGGSSLGVFPGNGYSEIKAAVVLGF